MRHVFVDRESLQKTPIPEWLREALDTLGAGGAGRAPEGPAGRRPAASKLALVTVLDVGEADFEREVIERSRTVPVVVDFWAEWCGPCRQLGPLLEQAAAEREGKVVLAKLDTDANQPLAQAFQIRGIPAVKAFKDARLVDEFVGAQDREAVQRFFDGLLPSEADELVEGGSEEDLRRALELQPGRADAALALARMLIGRGEPELGARAAGDASREACGRTAWRRACACRARACSSEAFAAVDRGELEQGLQLLLAGAALGAGPAGRDPPRDPRRARHARSPGSARERHPPAAGRGPLLTKPRRVSVDAASHAARRRRRGVQRGPI